MPREIRFKVNPNLISYFVNVKFNWDENDPENTSELKKLTLGQACNIIERDKKDLHEAQI